MLGAPASGLVEGVSLRMLVYVYCSSEGCMDAGVYVGLLEKVCPGGVISM